MSEAAAQGGFARLLSDDRLTRRAVNGDERAFAAIFRRYHQPLYRFCLAIVGNPEDAQDALQNTMMKVLRALPGEKRKIDLKPWLYRIAHNESIDLLRRRRETRQLDVEQAAPGVSLAEDAATRERLRRLLADLRELPERQREVLVMRELAGLDFDEIGSALGTSGAVARQTLYEARQSLHQMEGGREMSCDSVTLALSDGDGRVMRRRDVRAHLRSCAACRRFRDEIKGRERDFAALSPLPAVAAAGMLKALLGSGHSAGAGGLAATVGGGAAKGIGASAAVKGLATAAVVAAIGVTAADRGGVIHLGLPGDKGAASSSSEQPGAAGSSAGAAGAAGAVVKDGRAHGAAAGKAGGGGAHSKAAKVPVVAGGPAHGKHRGTAGAEAPAGTHPNGRGHEKLQPEAASKGQETAAEHKPTKPEQAGGGSGVRPKPEHSQPAPGPEAAPAHPAPAPKSPAAPEEAVPDSSAQGEAEAPAVPAPESTGSAKVTERIS